MKKITCLLFTIIISFFVITVNAESIFENGNNIYSENAYMVNLDTGKVVYALDENEIVYPASLTKVMTCILAIEHAESLDEIVVIPSGLFDDIYADNGANMALKVGEEISVGDLIRATMIRSACDSASALAWYVSGSIDAFAELMNKKAMELGAENTHFVNAHGLHSPNHYTTAKDMFLIAEYALKNETFCDIINEYTCTIPETNKSASRTLLTTMEIENPEYEGYYEYVTGIKSGFTDEAGRCLITKATKNNETYLLVTLGANKDRFYFTNMAYTDAVSLFEYCFAQYSINTIINKDEVLGDAKVEGGVIEKVSYSATDTLECLVALDDEVKIDVDISTVSAPIAEGQVLGTATVTVGDEEYVQNVVATTAIDKIPKETIVDKMNGGNKIATLLDCISILLVIASVAIIVIFILKAKKYKNKR